MHGRVDKINTYLWACLPFWRTNETRLQFRIHNINWTYKFVILVGIRLVLLDILSFCSLSIYIKIQLKVIQSLNGCLNSKRPNYCFNTFRTLFLSIQNNRPGYFDNILNPLLNNTILMVSPDATEGNCLVFGVELRHENIVGLPSVVYTV